MSDELSFADRKALFDQKFKASVQNPPRKRPTEAPTPHLHSATESAVQVDLNNANGSVCIEGPVKCVVQPESPYDSAARRKNTRKAVRRKKIDAVNDNNLPPPFKPPTLPARQPPSPNARRPPSPNARRSPSPNARRPPSPNAPPVRRSPSPNARRSPSPNAPPPPARRVSPVPGPDLENRIYGSDRRAPSPVPGPDRRAPSPIPVPARRATSPATDRRSLPPPMSNIAPPELPPRRHSCDKNMENDQQSKAPSQSTWYTKSPAPSTPPLHRLHPTKKPPPSPPSQHSPSKHTSIPPPSSNDSIYQPQRYRLDVPPPINLNSHPTYNLSTLPHSATLHLSARSDFTAFPPRPDSKTLPHRSDSGLNIPRSPPSIPRSPQPIPRGKSPEPPSVPPPPPPLPSSGPPPSLGPPPSSGLMVQPSEPDRISETEYSDEDDIYGDCLAITRDVDEAPEMEMVRRAPSAPAAQLNIMTNKGFRQLWHQRSEVQDSGILESETLSKKEKSRQEAMFEILTSEKTYGNSLDILFRQVVDDMIVISMLEEEDQDVVFMNIADIRSCNKRLCKELEQLYKGQVTIPSVTPILKKFADTEFQVYIEYCSMTSLQQDKLAELRANDPEFDILISEKEKNKVTAGQNFFIFNLQEYLLLPMQRICRMPLLLSAVLGKTDEDSEEHAAITQVYQHVCQTVDKCNEGLRIQQSMKYVRQLEKRFDFSKIGKVISITDNPERLLVKEGPVMKLTFKKSKVTSINLIFWLFDDFLLVGHKVDNNDTSDTSKYYITEHCPRALIKTKSYFQLPYGISSKKKNPTENIFHLELIATSNSKRHIIQCGSVTEKQRWIEVLSPVIKNEYEDETIYAAWDYPLVKTKYPYQSIQVDDLDLYEGDICKVIKKYTDGWCEGIRERDGKQGWFPLSYMEEIQTEHTAYRQIRKRYEAIEKMRTDADVTSALYKIRQ